MAKLVLPTITSGYLDTESLNAAFRLIENMAEQVIYRDGTAPNQMEASLDLNGFNLLNLAPSQEGNGLVTYDQVLQLIAAQSTGYVVQKVQAYTAGAGQQLFNLVNFHYHPGANNLAVFVNGLRKIAPTDFVETSPTSFTMVAPLALNDKVLAISNDFLATVELPAHTHPWEDLTGIPDNVGRFPTYAEVTGKPSTFTPSAHTHSTADITTGNGLADARRGVWVQPTQPTATRVGDLWFY